MKTLTWESHTVGIKGFLFLLLLHHCCWVPADRGGKIAIFAKLVLFVFGEHTGQNRDSSQIGPFLCLTVCRVCDASMCLNVYCVRRVCAYVCLDVPTSVCVEVLGSGHCGPSVDTVWAGSAWTIPPWQTAVS